MTYLVALAERRHFGLAARVCDVTQSTLSAGIRELEAVMGAQLVQRTKRSVALTPVGEEIVERAQILLGLARDMLHVARADPLPLAGTFRLGITSTLAPCLVPRALPSLRARYPDLVLLLRDGRSSDLVDLLHRGRLDAVLIALPFETTTLAVEKVGHDRLVVICAEDHPLAGRAAVATAELRGLPVLLLEPGHCLREHVLTQCDLPPASALDRLEASSLDTMLQMVAAGVGVSVVPEMTAGTERCRTLKLVAVPFADASPRRGVALCHHPRSPRGRDVAALADMLRPHLPVDGNA
jgi:LysR family hydrogen peroxide-inducible transcriptional activator